MLYFLVVLAYVSRLLHISKQHSTLFFSLQYFIKPIKCFPRIQMLQAICNYSQPFLHIILSITDHVSLFPGLLLIGLNKVIYLSIFDIVNSLFLTDVLCTFPRCHGLWWVGKDCRNTWRKAEGPGGKILWKGWQCSCRLRIYFQWNPIYSKIHILWMSWYIAWSVHQLLTKAKLRFLGHVQFSLIIDIVSLKVQTSLYLKCISREFYYENHLYDFFLNVDFSFQRNKNLKYQYANEMM